MKPQRLRNFRICLTMVFLFTLAANGCAQDTNLPVNTSSCRKITVEFPTEIMDKEKIFKNAALMSKYLDSCSLIQLETRPECLIGEINKIFIHKERIYILDWKVTKSVFIFDLNGKCISTIARMGHGPGEYINITDMFIDPLNETLNLLATANRKIMSFSLDGKALLSETTYSYPILSMEATREGSYVGYIGRDKINSTMIVFKDRSLSKLSYRAFPLPEGGGIYPGTESALANCSGDIFYMQPLQNKIYKMNPGSISLAYEFDFPSRNPDPNLTQEKLQNLPPDIKFRTIFRIMRFTQFSAGLIAEVNFESSSKLIFVTENLKNVEVIHTIVSPFLKFDFGRIVSLSAQNIITQINPRSVASALENKNFPEWAPFIKRYVRNPIKEDDNPILCVYHLK